jgi:hypothetical protein
LPSPNPDLIPQWYSQGSALTDWFLYLKLIPHVQHICLLTALMMKVARTSEVMVNFYQTAWHYNPEENV